jgi:predicted ABC-type ATPase
VEILSPTVVVIAGINGAGKSTAAESLLAEFGVDVYLDADAFARMLSDDPARAAIKAGRVMRAQIDRLRDSAANFALETTLSGHSLRRTLEDLHAAGYRSRLLYLWLPDAHMAVRRVRGRVLLGGHHIRTEDVLRRYLRSVRNFERSYRYLVDEWRVYHAALGQWGRGGVMIARGWNSGRVEVYNVNAWREIQAQASHASEGGADDD